MTPGEIQTLRIAIEAKMRTLIPQIERAQLIYRAMNGRPWQGSRTHSNVPADGVLAAPDLLTAEVENQGSWTQMGITVPPSEGSFRVDSYDGPGGAGCTLTATVIINGNTWQRTANIGPEDHRATGWQRLGAPV